MRLGPMLGRSLARVLSAALLPASVAGFVSLSASTPVAAASGCQLNSANGAIKHVIEIQFDNTHFTRDNPNVPSDLEQMPNLLNFMKSQGTLLTNHHTPLISHTANDILTTLTGVYPDRHGVPVANSFRYFNPDGSSNLGVSFAYWTDPIFDPTTNTPTDTTFNMLTAQGTNAPAPWVPFTRAGCDVGGVGTANIELENTGTGVSGDMTKVFGVATPEWNEALASNTEAANLSAAHLPPDALSTQAQTDFVGIAIHCAVGGGKCAGNSNARTDALPQETGGYTGFQGLFGAKYVNPAITKPSQAVVNDIYGNGHPINDPFGQPGFPGFDGMSAAVSLGYVATMQEQGVPVTYAYISDAHDKHTSGPAYGPGEAGYVAALKAYDDAFGKFFTRLANDGINKSNTLFVFTSDEGDHFGGGTPTPAGCDGVNVPCVYTHMNCNATSPPTCPSNNVGETNANLAGLLATQQGITTPFKVHADSAPTVYITGNPPRTDPTTRSFERAAGKLVGTNPQTGASEAITRAMADPIEMKLLHMITADPARTPTFTYFADPAYFLFQGAPNCNSACIQQQFGFAWNHGDFQPEIVTTWLGLVGPGVKKEGVTHEVWSDHTDVRPTLLALVGLKDDYSHQGRVLFEVLKSSALPRSLRQHGETLQNLADVYKQLNASVGKFGLDTLKVSTRALESGSAANDTTYVSLETKLASLGTARDAVATQMESALENAAFGGKAINVENAKSLINQGEQILEQASELAQGGEGGDGGEGGGD